MHQNKAFDEVKINISDDTQKSTDILAKHSPHPVSPNERIVEKMVAIKMERIDNFLILPWSPSL
jgi:hypothetical protein